MTAIARRTWSQVETEVIKRLGNIDSPGFSARADNWIWEAYKWLSLTYHHFELDEIDGRQVTPTNGTAILLPDDCYSLIAVIRRDAAGKPTGSGLTRSWPSSLFADFTGQVGIPSKYARYGSKVFLNTISDQPYPLDIYYYRLPTQPDFASNSLGSELGADLDESLINLTLQVAFPAIGRPDLGDYCGTLASNYLQMQSRPALITEPLAVRERIETNRTIGGGQG